MDFQKIATCRKEILNFVQKCQSIQNCQSGEFEDSRFVKIDFTENLSAQYGIFYYDQKGVISGQYGSLSKKLAKIGYFHKIGFENCIEEEISFSNI